MRKKSSSQSGLFNPRVLTAVLLFLCASALLMFAAAPPSKQKTAVSKPVSKKPIATPASPTPAGATLSTSNRSITYTESGAMTPNETGVALGAPDCTVPNSCSTFNLTIDPTVGIAGSGYTPAQFQIHMIWSWSVSTVDYDIFFEDAAGNVVAVNNSTADPSSIIIPTTTPAGLYKVVIVLATGAPIGFTGTVVLESKPATAPLCGGAADCTPPRYINYAAGDGQADDAGEPSLGVDWNPNVAALKFQDATHNLNHSGVAFFTSGPHEWRVNFDDCPSPAINNWEDVSATFTQQFVLSDPIGFVDHYTSNPLGLVYPPPHTPGRVFTLDLIGGQGDSLGSFSDTDGNSYLPGGTGGPGQGPDHETLGGGPYSGTPPATASYPASGTKNAIYYCSQNIVAEAQCSRSDDGGQTFGPGVPIFTPTQCTGGIHGHVKVAPDGTVYVPNSSCGTVGTSGVAVSTDNGLTWTENNVPGSSSTQDPSAGIGQNDVGKPGSNLTGTNTIYFGYVDGDGHPKVAHSGNRGANWSTPIDVGTPFGVTHAVFPVVVAGDDNRAAFAFVGTGDGIATSGSCDPYGATLNCANIWHLYVSTTYDGGANWITVDATPNDPVQQGTICLQGTTCAGGRNLLDFNDFAIDSEGRGLVGYADGCPNCNNVFQGQSGASHGTVTRQSGGRRLFHAFDPVEPMPPAAPQMVSAIRQSPSGALITWLEPDNGGSPITGYNVYRGTTSGTEIFLAHVSGETNTKYLDPSPPAGNAFYYAQAINTVGEGPHCGEVSITVGLPPESECTLPGVTKLTDPQGDTSAVLGLVSTPAPPGADLKSLQIAQPYQPDNVARLVFTINTWDNGQSPQAPGSSWYVSMKVPVSARAPNGFIAVHMTWSGTTPTFESYQPAPSGGTPPAFDGRFVTAGSQIPAEATSHYTSPFNQVVIVVKASDLGLNPGDTITGFVSAVSQTEPGPVGVITGLFDMMPDSLAYTGNYTVDSNQVCRPNVAPIPFMTATPITGTAPLTVNFDASGSHDPDTAPPPDTIASYTLDFGDGSAPVTQATPLFSHTYNSNGDFPARLSVTDSRGKPSTSDFQLVISVDSTLTGAVSRKVHASAGPFDINLPLVGSPRGVECRTGGASNAYTIIYTFARGLTQVDSATVTQGTGTIDTVNSGIGPNGNQYTVNLTGVTNGQYLNVQLDGVHDTAGAIIDEAIARVGILIGDVNANGLVNSTDVSQTQAQSGQTVTSSNFRKDVNANGLITSTDVSNVQSKSGTGLPSSP
jgi:hypothetical protein